MPLELDIEYTNGFRETVTIDLDKPYKMPFEGKIVAERIVGVKTLYSADPTRLANRLRPKNKR